MDSSLVCKLVKYPSKILSFSNLKKKKKSRVKFNMEDPKNILKDKLVSSVNEKLRKSIKIEEEEEDKEKKENSLKEKYQTPVLDDVDSSEDEEDNIDEIIDPLFNKEKQRKIYLEKLISNLAAFVSLAYLNFYVIRKFLFKI